MRAQQTPERWSRSGKPGLSHRRLSPIHIALIYLLLGSCWIIITDLVAEWLFADHLSLQTVQTVKGLFYILVTALLVYWLARLAVRGQRDDTLRQQLEKEQDAIRKILSNLGEAVFFVDPEDRSIVNCNSAVENLFGFQPEELIGQNTLAIHIDRNSYDRFAELSEPVLNGWPFRIQYPFKRKDGSIFEAEVTVVALQNDLGWQKGVVSIIRDLSDRMAMEAELRQTQKLESIGTLATGIAHEVKNPITVITNYADLIVDKVPENSEVCEISQYIKDQTERVHAIVSDMLGYARDERGEPLQPHSLKKLVDATLSLSRSLLRSDHIEIEIDLPENLPDIACYGQQVQQVIMNLLTNARDALNKKYPGADPDKKIVISARHLEHAEHDCVEMIVEDHGIGMPGDIFERMYDPFFTTKPKGKGTGLGLWISRSIIQRHNATISIESEPGRFTRVFVQWPTINSAEEFDNDHNMSYSK